jgi:predicted signal transduction protein with EAL and GGDEF domain
VPLRKACPADAMTPQSNPSITDEVGLARSHAWLGGHRPATFAPRNTSLGMDDRDALVEKLADLQASQLAGAMAVVVVAVDDFQEMSAALGHLAVNEMVSVLVGRLQALSSSPNGVHRLGEDRFGLVRWIAGDGDASLTLARRTSRLVRHDLACGPQRVPVSVAVGVAVGTDQPARGLLEQAEIAAGTARRRGGEQVAVHGTAAHPWGAGHFRMSAELTRAISQDELYVEYQPIIRLPHAELVAMEALVRWRHPDHGTVSPATFIPLAEEAGQVHQVDRWVLVRACSEIAAMPGQHRLCVNVSAQQLADSELPDLVLGALQTSGLAANRLVLEITESALVDAPRQASLIIDRMRQSGVSIALDDFGTGWSNLGHLLHWSAVDIVKIDRTFIRGIADGARERAVVSSVVDLARRLGVELIAEGVETAPQREALVSIGCDLAQGFLFGMPAGLQEAHRPFQ